jgi:hypothetical protein
LRENLNSEKRLRKTDLIFWTKIYFFYISMIIILNRLETFGKEELLGGVRST